MSNDHIPRWGRSISADEWRRRLLALPVPARHAAARIVWWEFYSLLLVGERETRLDDLIRHHETIPDEELVDALIRVGWPATAAHGRIKPERTRDGRRERMLAKMRREQREHDNAPCGRPRLDLSKLPKVKPFKIPAKFIPGQGWVKGVYR